MVASARRSEYNVEYPDLENRVTVAVTVAVNIAHKSIGLSPVCVP